MGKMEMFKGNSPMNQKVHNWLYGLGQRGE